MTRDRSGKRRRALQPRHVRRMPADADFVDPRPARRPSKLKYHTYYELVENQDRKVKLTLLKSYSMKPPPQFDFVPAGNPKLTEACKEASREWGFPVYIVATNDVSTDVAEQMCRVGFHFHSFVVANVMARSPDLEQPDQCVPRGIPEPIPASLAVYHSQVDAALRDLFPRIPNTDRHLIIQHAFCPRRAVRGPKPPVGFNHKMPLARRVQLATIAHVRHCHTRYEELLKEGFIKPEARKVIQRLCLDILVKWRGDEENGRDQIEEVLREVIVIPDDSDDDSEAEPTQGSSDSKASASLSPEPVPASPQHAGRADRQSSGDSDEAPEPLALSAMDGGAPRVPQGRAPEPGDQAGLPIWVGVARRDPVPRRPLDHSDGHDYQFAAQRGPGTDSRPLPWNSAACAPAPDGHLPQGARPYHRLHEDVYPAPERAAPASIYTDLGEAEFMAREQSAQDVQLYQDTVVRSIEPAYPDPSQPTFVRSLPAGTEHCLPLGRSRASSPRQLTRNGYGSVVSGRLPREPAQSASFQANAPSYPPPGSDFWHNPPPVTLPRRPALMDEPARSSAQPQADRIVLNASRPGTRANPILMEDRGGFYERISTSPELVPPALMPAHFSECDGH